MGLSVVLSHKDLIKAVIDKHRIGTKEGISLRVPCGEQQIKHIAKQAG